MKKDNILKKLLSFGFVKTVLILAITYFVCSVSYGASPLTGIAGVLVVGQALIIEAIKELKE